MPNITLNNKLIYVAIGLQFRFNFIIENKLGQILNSILYSKNSFFDTKFFTGVESANNQKRLISDKQRTNILTINPQNIILEIGNTKKYSSENIEKKFEEEILNYVLKEYKLEGIGRIGYLKRYEISDADIANVFDKKIDFGEKLQDVNLHFSKRPITSKSTTSKDNNDYFNLIYDFSKRITEDKLRIGIDTQKYFNPTADYADFLDDGEYKDFIEKVKYYNEDNFLNWFKKYCGENTDAAD